MTISFGYSPKIEKFIPLGDFPQDRYLIIARQAIENLGWSLSHISERGIIAYTPVSLQSYSEEISIRIENNFAIFKSECVGIQMLFTDYGKNAVNMEKFFHEFEYVEFHLKDVWEDSLQKFHDFVATQDKDYFEKAPLTAKNKIKNIFYLLLPQKNYLVTPILVLTTGACFVISTIFLMLFASFLVHKGRSIEVDKIGYYIGATSREQLFNGQFWRLITYQFLHAGISHIFFNMYALVYIGLMVEHKLGRWKYIATYLISGICGGLLSAAYHDSGYMVGASGAIMGLFGAFMALLLSKAFERNATKALLISTLFVVAIMLVNGSLKEGVDNAAHVGGLISGFIIGYLLYNEKLWKWTLPLKLRYAFVAFLTLIFAAVVLLLTPQIQTKEFVELEEKYKQNWKTYHTIFKLPADLPTGKKLTIVQERGIDLWKENELLVKKMLALKLTKKQRMQAEFNAKVVEIQSKIVVLLYKECAESTKYYRREIRELTRELNALRMESD
ncbi:rhomboid family intramembrane serine protease [Pedobacter insulae]|uniref:Rhomboid protease GluP n=1 Tax=Pedobacter insulae TaxID=414048 RepID=A0A1I2T9Y1_9SPHI|nr:rhomboid family intramembrane serine protease [Pedobacter insulae]SFG60047.1 rhomboid protease GluP [Pedobacter insulae]